jgi:hypothetical protein
MVVSLPTSVAPASAAFLRLPDELLLKVAGEIDGNEASHDLRQLALTHSRFRPIVHETLVCNGVAPVCNVSTYIIILSRHPERARRIEKVTLVHGLNDYAYASQRAMRACFAANRVMWPDTSAKDERDMPMLDKMSPVWARVLFVVLGNLKELSAKLEDNDASLKYIDSVLDSLPPHNLPNSIHYRLMDLVHDRLESLSVTVGTSADRVYREANATLFLNSMKKLKIVTLTGDVLRHKTLSPMIASATLPPSVEVLRIYCSQVTFPWKFLNEMYKLKAAGDELHYLRQVQLFFSLPCRSMARYLVCQADPQQLHGPSTATVTELLAKWEKLEPSFETYFLNRGEPGGLVLDPRQYKKGCLLNETRCYEEELGRSLNFWV